MENILTVAELKRRGMAAIEEGLRHGPLRIVKRNRSAAVVLSEDDYRRLTGIQPDGVRGLSALQWLLTVPASGTRSKDEIERDLADERNW